MYFRGEIPDPFPRTHQHNAIHRNVNVSCYGDFKCVEFRQRILAQYHLCYDMKVTKQGCLILSIFHV